jgi:hypothetical protein
MKKGRPHVERRHGLNDENNKWITIGWEEYRRWISIIDDNKIPIILKWICMGWEEYYRWNSSIDG